MTGIEKVGRMLTTASESGDCLDWVNGVRLRKRTAGHNRRLANPINSILLSLLSLFLQLFCDSIRQRMPKEIRR